MSHQKSQQKEIKCTGEHQEVLDLLKTHLTSLLVLGYPDSNHPFDMKTDTSLQGLGAILSQRDNNGKGHVVAYASRFLHPNEHFMSNYSLAKVELFMLK